MELIFIYRVTWNITMQLSAYIKLSNFVTVIQYHKLHIHLLSDHSLLSTKYPHLGNNICPPGNIALQIVRQELFRIETTQHWVTETAPSTR